jgi:hypothetical protein
LFGAPITVSIDFLAYAPPFLVLYWMIRMPFKYPVGDAGSMSDLMQWLCDYRRIPFYIGIRLARVLISPFVRIVASILVKWIVIGRFSAGPRDTTSEFQLLRHWLAATLFSRDKIQDVTNVSSKDLFFVDRISSEL